MTSVLSAARFHNEDAAFAHVEAMLWPNGPVCPKCGNVDGTKIGRLQGKSSRPGLRKCYACRETFTVRIGTIFEDSHAPMKTWLQAIHLMVSSKKGISTRQLQRTLGVGLKTAWHMGHRIRAAMAPNPANPGRIGGEGKTVEIDETFVTNSVKTRKRADGKRRYQRIMSLVERGGQTRSLSMDGTSAGAEMYRHLAKGSHVMTDGATGMRFPPYAASHEVVVHAKGEYVRGKVHTNTVEGFFSVFKRGVIGVYQHMDAKHLDRYLAEFDFRQSTRSKLGINDEERACRAVAGFAGKRLTYQTTRD